MANDVAHVSDSSRPFSNGNIVTKPTDANASGFRAVNVDTADVDARGAAPTDTDLETKYTDRFDDASYYSA